MERDHSSSPVQYAVIETVRSDAPPELFVISYRTELSLRTVIADFCIVATGFATRDQAIEACQGQLCSAA